MSTSIKMLASEMSEAEAIEGAKQGDGECFEILYSRHERRVYSICLRMIRNVEQRRTSLRKPSSSSFAKSQPFAAILHFPLGCIALPSTCPYALRKKGLPVGFP